jgi:hypothetical protein
MAIHEPPVDGGRSALGPAFPQRNAFVLQFAADSGPWTGHFHGRVQHVASGRQLSFCSLEELRDFIGQVLLGSGGTSVPAAGDG